MSPERKHGSQFKRHQVGEACGVYRHTPPNVALLSFPAGTPPGFWYPNLIERTCVSVERLSANIYVEKSYIKVPKNPIQHF
jgi:hypothetical protein